MWREQLVLKSRFWPISQFHKNMPNILSLKIYSHEPTQMCRKCADFLPCSPNNGFRTFGALKIFFWKTDFFVGITTQIWDLDLGKMPWFFPGDRNTFFQIPHPIYKNHATRGKKASFFAPGQSQGSKTPKIAGIDLNSSKLHYKYLNIFMHYNLQDHFFEILWGLKNLKINLFSIGFKLSE